MIKVAESLAQKLVAKIFLRAFAEAAERLTHPGEAPTEPHSSEEEEEETSSVIVADVRDNSKLAPEFHVNGEAIVASEGESITISANYRGAPCHAARWLLNGRVVNEGENRTVHHSPGHSQLHLQNVNAGDMGTYECQVENAYGAALYTCTIQLGGMSRITTIEQHKLITGI